MGYDDGHDCRDSRQQVFHCGGGESDLRFFLPQGAAVDAFVFVDKLETALKKSQTWRSLTDVVLQVHTSRFLLIGLTDMFLFLSPR